MNLRFDHLLSLLLSVGTLVLVSSVGHAASFDCDKAASATEKTICADSKLSKLDEKLSGAWTTVSGIKSDPAVTKSSQLQWLKLRNACGADVSCLIARYNERLAALVNAQFPAGADQAGNRLEALLPKDESADADAGGCTADKLFCVQIHKPDNAPSEMRIDYAGASPFSLSFTLPDAAPDADSEDTGPGAEPGDVTLWPRVLRPVGDKDAILVGAVYGTWTSYSGGGGSASSLRLFRVSRNKAASHDADEILSVPIGGSLGIRACFSDEDERKRRGACHDEYNFAATLGLDPTVTSGFPRLVYQTRATSFPGKVSRYEDSLEKPPLREQDLVTAVNQRCTYKRTFQLESGSGVYVPDQPLPDCDDYTAP